MESQKEIDLALAKLEKDFGKGTVVLASGENRDVDAISTGSIQLDKATGIGGYPQGRIVEIYGPESSGKTTLCLTAIREAQIKYPDKMTAIVDMEHALDLNYAESLGINLEKLHISQPDYGEQALQVVRELVATKGYSVIVVDSVAALIPKSELEGEVGDAAMGKQARMMSQSLRMLTPAVENTDTLVIFTNQLRDKIGVMFGSPETTTGGNALKFYASMRLDIRRIATNKDDDISVSNRVKVKIAKNKMSAPFRIVEFNIVFGEGIDRLNEILKLCVDYNIIKKAGSWYSYGETRLGQGESSVLDLMKDNIELVLELENKITEHDSKVKEVTS